MKKDIIKKITQKKEFSDLPERDVELAFENFDKPHLADEEKVKLTRDLLRRVFSAFTSQKLFSGKYKSAEAVLKKHLSTRERLPYYPEIYSRIFEGMKSASVLDLGAGVNGFSYDFFEKSGVEVDYAAVESIGQLADLMNIYFEKEKANAKAIRESLFEKEKIVSILEKQKKPRVIFMFKVLDSLEMIRRDYSKELISDLAKYSEKIVVSFATRSMIKRTRFKARRYWITNFIKENFEVLDDFEIGTERYIVFSKKQTLLKKS